MANRPSTHGPIKIVNVGENVWGGKFTISIGDPVITTFSGLSTKVFRTGCTPFFSPINGAAAAIANVTNNVTRMYVDLASSGVLRVVHAVPTGDADFSFIVMNGGTLLT